MTTQTNTTIEQSPDHRMDQQKDGFRLKEYFHVKIFYKGSFFSAQLSNLSARGAHLIAEKYDPLMRTMQIGEEIDLDVKTLYGFSQCTARVVWMDLAAEPLSLGVEFTKLSDYKFDGLRCAIDSPI